MCVGPEYCLNVLQARSVEEIMRRLKSEDTPLGREILGELEKRSPLVLKVLCTDGFSWLLAAGLLGHVLVWPVGASKWPVGASNAWARMWPPAPSYTALSI